MRVKCESLCVCPESHYKIFAVILSEQYKMQIHELTILCGSLSPRQGVSSSCGPPDMYGSSNILNKRLRTADKG